MEPYSKLENDNNLKFHNGELLKCITVNHTVECFVVVKNNQAIFT